MDLLYSNPETNICFYNMNHIGDIYFSSLFINLICELNKNYTFYYYSINGSIFFEKNKNINRIVPLEKNYLNELTNGVPPENLLNNEILQLLINNNMQQTSTKNMKINNINVLFINTWCASELLNHTDFDIQHAMPAYKNLIENINKHYHLNIEFKINIPNDLINNVLEVSDNELINKIFIFNFIPRSINFDINNLNNYILNQSQHNKIILSCYNDIFKNNTNIEFCDKTYNIYPEPTCNNLINIWEIANKCNKIILLPSGCTWTFLHKLNNFKQNQLYMFNSFKYCNILNNSINYLLRQNKNLINNI